jgi:hypothetical protein
MNKSLLLLFVVIIGFTVAAFAQTEKPLASFPYTPGLDVTSMDEEESHPIGPGGMERVREAHSG